MERFTDGTTARIEAGRSGSATRPVAGERGGQGTVLGRSSRGVQERPNDRSIGVKLELPGDVIECGVYRGGTLAKIFRTVSKCSADKQVFACDSFEGFPEEDVGRIDVGYFRFLSRIRKNSESAMMYRRG